jgi:type IV pilus assembly protein PilC
VNLDSLKERARRWWASRLQPDQITCPTSSLSSFTKQLATLLGSGISLFDALGSLSREESDEVMFSRVVPDIAKRVTQGTRLSVCLGAYSRIFPRTYLALIRAAEETGNLVPVLDDLAHWLERKEQGHQHIKKALSYPAVIVVVSGVLTMGLFQTVIPGILDTVLGLGVALPAPTRLLLIMVAVAKSPLTWVLGVLALLATIAYVRTESGYQRALHTLARLPLVGEFLNVSGASRFALTLSMLLERGVDLMRGVRIASEATGNPLLENDANRIMRGIREGDNLGECLQESPLYPRLLVGMAEVGEESGQLSGLLRRAGDILADDAGHRVDTFLALLEPVVLGVLSMAVGFVVVAILMPLASLTASL